jgi:hypothetical protein
MRILLLPVKPICFEDDEGAQLCQALSSLRIDLGGAIAGSVLADGTLDPRDKFDLIRHRTQAIDHEMRQSVVNDDDKLLHGCKAIQVKRAMPTLSIL